MKRLPEPCERCGRHVIETTPKCAECRELMDALQAATSAALAHENRLLEAEDDCRRRLHLLAEHRKTTHRHGPTDWELRQAAEQAGQTSLLTEGEG